MNLLHSESSEIQSFWPKCWTLFLHQATSFWHRCYYCIHFCQISYPSLSPKLVFQYNWWSKNIRNKPCTSVKVYIKTVLFFCACNWLNLSTIRSDFPSNVLTLKKKWSLYKYYRILKVTSLPPMCMQTNIT